MVALPDLDLTTAAIYRAYEMREQGEPPRGYLGGSQIGEECRRQLFYSFRQVARPSFPGRILRLFETGHREEERIIANLREVGCDVCAEQWEVTCCDGHCRGHFDGVVTGLIESPETPHLLECKTINDRGFEELSKKGVEAARPVHYAQMQLYGTLGELTRWCYIAQNKNTDELHFERGKVKRTEGKALVRKAQAIINAESPPDRIAKDRRTFFRCCWCNFADYCWGERFPVPSCRTCAHGAPGPDGSWTCARGLAWPCDEHIFLPSLLHWATPIDGDPTQIRYKADGREFLNCRNSQALFDCTDDGDVPF